MEKVIAALWAPDAALRERLPERLRAAGASRIRLNLRDDEVEAGARHVQRWQEPDAVVQFWLPSANPSFFAPAASALNVVRMRCRSTGWATLIMSSVVTWTRPCRIARALPARMR